MSTLNTYQNICVTGDINIDIKINTNDKKSTDYLNLIMSHGLLPTHNLPTRHENCLEHVLLKSHLNFVTLVIQSSITDHYPTLLSLSLKKVVASSPPFVNRINYSAIRKEIKETDFTPVLVADNANFAADYLVTRVAYIIKKNTSSHKIPRRKRNIKPWITPGLIRCIHNRDRMHRKHNKDPNNITLKITYVRYINYINKFLKKLKRNYEQN